MNLDNTEEVVESCDAVINTDDEVKSCITKIISKSHDNINDLISNSINDSTESQNKKTHRYYSSTSDVNLSCLDIIKKVRKEGYSNSRKDVYGDEFTPRVVMDFNVIIDEKLDDMKCNECGEINALNNDFFQNYLEDDIIMCRKCCSSFLDNKCGIDKLNKIYDLVDNYEFEILEYKKDVLKRGDLSEVYKSKIIIENEVFYVLILCYVFKECNELSSDPYDYFSYVTFIFKDLNTLNKNYDTLEIVTNYMNIELRDL